MMGRQYLRSRMSWSERQVYRPSFLQSPQDRVLVNTGTFRPIRHAQRLSIPRQIMIRSTIASLRVFRRPYAVLAGISTSVIEAFQRMCKRWSVTHILREGFKSGPFWRVDCDSSASIVFPPRIFWIGAALPHHRPASVFGCARSPVRQRRVCQPPFSSDATTTLYLTPVIRTDKSLVSTATSATPLRLY